MPRLIFIVGVPGSGKSTYAKTLENDKTKVLSSDVIRRQLNHQNNDASKTQDVFEVLFKRAQDLLKRGYNVVVDSTNINRKARRQSLANFDGFDKEVPGGISRECMVICAPYERCIENDQQRDRHVNKDAIDRYVSMFEIPTKAEGFDNIMFKYYDNPPYMSDKLDKAKEFYYQSVKKRKRETLYDHLFNTWLAAQWHPDFGRFTDKMQVAIESAALYHDIGKMYSQTIDANEIPHYYNHQNWSAYIAMCSGDFLEGWITPEAVALINYHMTLYNKDTGDKTLQLLRKEDSELSKALWTLHEANDIAHPDLGIIMRFDKQDNSCVRGEQDAWKE